jgi:transcriptional regulator with XRE-family HTH domain
MGPGDANVCADRNPPQTPREPAGAFGDLLRRSREGRGIALGAVASKTRIAPHHLEALERGDLAALPAGPFGRAYVRAYAEALGVDPEPILEAYRLQERERGFGTPESERRMLEELSHLVARGAAHAGGRRARLDPRTAVLGAAVVVGILVALGGFLARNHLRERNHARERNDVREAAAQTPPPPPTPVASPGAPPPARPQRPEPAAASPPTDSLQVSAFGTGAGVVDRRLVGRSDRFTEGSRVVFWTEVLGGRPGHVIRHVWFQEGRAVMRANLAVRGPYWRTHSTLTLPRGSAGGWTVEARTSDGRLLARNDFLCEPPGAPPSR